MKEVIIKVIFEILVQKAKKLLNPTAGCHKDRGSRVGVRVSSRFK